MKDSKSLEERRLGMKKAFLALDTMPAYKGNEFYKGIFENYFHTQDKAGVIYRSSKS
jgi:hypothetical protein